MCSFCCFLLCPTPPCLRYLSPPSSTQDLVLRTQPATQRVRSLPHAARVLLFRYRLVHGATFSLLGQLFLCGRKEARKSFWDVAMFNLMCDPLGSLPNLFTSDVTDDQLERLLLDIIARQSPGVQRLVSRLRTPNGRQVSLLRSLHLFHYTCYTLHALHCTVHCTTH